MFCNSLNGKCQLILVLIFALVILLPVQVSVLQARPNVVPSLQQWKNAKGTYSLTSSSRIVVDSNYFEELSDLADTFREDLAVVYGFDFKIVKASSSKSGDVFLTLNNWDAGIGEQGYLLEIADKLTIRANAADGVFYGTQSVLQMLKQAGSSKSIERGVARDYPKYKERGIMIDAGRKYWQMDYLEETIRNLAWYKMNFIHLHFTDWSGFRLKSDLFPGLASDKAYSKADIRRLQDIAKRYHVIVVPEIDLPAHATAITDYNPYLAFSCPSLRRASWQGEETNKANRAWLLDITRPEVRKWISDLLDEFIPLFDGPYFHIGGDEWQYDTDKYACPELMAAMKARGYSEPGDLFVEWINEINAQVKSYGKQTQMWNWWRFSPDKQRQNKTSIQPNKDIVVNVWNRPRLKQILEDGYEIIITTEEGENALYITPGYGKKAGDYGYFDTKIIYEQWDPTEHPNVRGFKACIWADKVEDKEDEWFDTYAEGPKAVLAERVWGGPRSETVEEFFKRVELIGPAPGKGAR